MSHVGDLPAVDDDLIGSSQGLDEEEAARRLAVDGHNVLPKPPVPTLAKRVRGQLADPLSLVLIAAAALTLVVLHKPAEGAAISAIIVLNAAIGATQERRADSAIAALEALVPLLARVYRSGRVSEISASEIVCGDLVEVVAGDRIPADLLLIEAASLAIDEALLTGEARPAEKKAGHVHDPGAPAGDRLGEAFAGTVVVRGRGLGTVTRTGPATEIGAIAASFGKQVTPPLVRELRSVAQRMSLIAFGVGAMLTVLALARGADLLDAVLAGVALAVAAVPEGLATAVTTALALGARRMAGMGAIVRRLPAIEALGSASIICTDKTGTITTGRLAVAEVVAIQGREAELWNAALRCNDADGAIGDPVDVALVEAARARKHYHPVGTRVAEQPFDAANGYMATVHMTDQGPTLSIKGAPEVVLARCTPGPDRDLLSSATGVMAAQGLRVLAVAAAATGDVVTAGLDALGLVGFHDPLRPATRDTIARCRDAGIRLVLVTGDHIDTARSVALDAGIGGGPALTGAGIAALAEPDRTRALVAAAVVARVDPGTKVALVNAHQAAGHIVAMTGDGVNDAPALRRADIGVALAGAGGSDVAREAADLVVTDNDLGTLVEAIREGRRIYRNLVSVVSYLLAGNVSEVLVIMGSAILLPDLIIPLLPVQLLWVNFITDGLPALALGVDRASDDPLDEPPRSPGEQILSWSRQWMLLGRALVIATAVLAAGLMTQQQEWNDDVVRAQLVLTLIVAHLLLAYVSRARKLAFESGWWRNLPLFGAVTGSLALQIPVFGTAPGRALLSLAPLPASGWLLAIGAGIAVVIILDTIRAGSRWI